MGRRETWIFGIICALIGAFAWPFLQAVWQSAAEVKITVEYSKFELAPPSPSYYGASGILFTEVQNTGERRASAVKLKVPNAEVARYEFEGRKIVSTGSTILINELEPGEKIPMTIWTRYEPSEFSLRDISLTHSEGVGQVIIEQKYMGNPIWLFIKQWGILWLLMGLLILNMFYNAYIEVKKSQSAQHKS